MIRFLTAAMGVALLMGCNNIRSEKKAAAGAVHVYPAISYLDIKLGPHGELPANPYIVALKNGNKEIVFCGVNHLADDGDIDNPMFGKIEQQFFLFRPEVAVNEGGDISNKKYASRKDALQTDGEIGLTKILCDSLKIKTVDGDPGIDYEARELLKMFSPGEFLAYIATERLMWGLKGQHITDSAEIEKRYDAFVQHYIIGEGAVRLTKAEQGFSFFKTSYEQLLGRPFDMATLEPTNPFEPDGKFQKIGRVSKEIRDQYLMQTIDKLLDTHDKVFIVFGGWHLLTCRPGLEEIINKKRG